ncbi:MAG: hypothetical protein RLZZ301_453 [Bacteroidota bacterium]|jgi:tRNA pseudouridine32 synthase/23S rRNA pseudouridine746 synthase
MFIPLPLALQQQPTPAQFTFPFYYEPHPLARFAASELQKRLLTEDLNHDFGIGNQQRNGAIGKMFGVLIVKNHKGELGYLAAFSGKLGNSNEHTGFVPPVFDLLEAQGFFRQEEQEIHQLTLQIEALESAEAYSALQEMFVLKKAQIEQRLATEKLKNAQAKHVRAERRAHILLSAEPTEQTLELLRQESIHDSYRLKQLKTQLQLELLEAQRQLYEYEQQLESLRLKRASWSADLQRRIFERYYFLNANGESKNVLALFNESPPAGAGECAAPKLLHFAYQQGYQPICMAEFWWGMSPDSEVRIHQSYYPACKSKCEPILGFMLQGLLVDPNPITAIHPARSLDILYEDEWIVAIHKSPEYLSVPGKLPQPNCLEDLKKRYPNADGPLLVHRLDMSTSGILLAAKTKLMHERLQRQFVTRKVKKRYIAVLDGLLSNAHGEIKLPLRVDLDDRPRQLVCFEHGSYAHTSYEVLSTEGNLTRVSLIPHTGRTHQLRVHAAHHLGLACPILGDDLYGQKGERLHLHAAYLGFFHPHTNEWMELECAAEF